MGGRRKGIAALALAVGLTLGTSGISDAVTVGVRGIRGGVGYSVWSPKVRRIAPGTIVRWFAVNTRHNVTSRGANWSFFRSLPKGTNAARRFNRRGTFRYYCTIHGHVAPGVCHGMCGSIIVG
jgi:plastocyanin